MTAVVLAGSPSAQNLDAGKPAAQIFSEVCANCHRSVRELKSTASASFMREHYTTGSDMASTMASYLAAVGSDPRAAPAQPKRQPPAVGSTPARDVPPSDAAKDARHLQQSAEPKPPSGSPVAAPAQPSSNKLRPGLARAEASKPVAAAETKPPVPPAPVLEEFEE